jgi:signal transduction histidine kinase
VDTTKEEIKEITTHMSRISTKMVSLIDELLDVSKLRLGKLNINKEDVTLSILVEDIFYEHHFMANKKGIKLISDVPNDCKVFIDKKFMGEVLKNLVSNAIKFCNNGDKVVISYDLESKSLLVKDTGVGMPEKLMKDLFEFQNKTSRRGTLGEEGTGLGLPLCKDIVEAHGGTLSAESIEGKGSTFAIKIE